MPEQIQKAVRVGGNLLPVGFHGDSPGMPEGEAVADALGANFEKQAGIFCPPVYILPDTAPEAFLVGQRVVKPGIPIDPGDLQDAAGLFQKWLKKLLAQRLHGRVQCVYVLLFVFQKPVPVVVHANAPEKIDGFRGETFKHSAFPSFILRIPADR